MLELENFGLVELNAQEVEEVEGGVWPIIIAGCAFHLALGLTAGAAYYYATH